MLKIYETRSAPNARRVRMFLAEKGIDMEYVELDIVKGENLSDEVRKKNVTTKIPFLEFDDGQCLGETMAICRYFEELNPEPCLMGETPREKAEIEMWQRRVEWYLFMPVGMCFQHTTGYFKDRMTPVNEWGEVCRENVQKFLDVLEQRLAESSYIAGERFSVADITALCAIDFARVIKVRLSDDHIHLKRWYEVVKQRESASA